MAHTYRPSTIIRREENRAFRILQNKVEELRQDLSQIDRNKAANLLADNQKELFVLFMVLDGHPHREIARLCNVSNSRVGQLLRKAFFIYARNGVKSWHSGLQGRTVNLLIESGFDSKEAVLKALKLGCFNPDKDSDSHIDGICAKRYLELFTWLSEEPTYINRKVEKKIATANKLVEKRGCRLIKD